MKPRRGAREQIDRVHRGREGREIAPRRRGQVYDIIQRPLFLRPFGLPAPGQPKDRREKKHFGTRETERERERERERKRDKRVVEGAEDKKVKQKADYVTRGMKYGGWQRRGWNETRPDTIG